MAQSAPLTEDEQQAIIALFKQGKSRNVIAAEVGRSGYTVSKIIKQHELAFPGAEQTRAKSEAWVKQAAARRQALADKMLENAERLADSVFSERTYFDWGGKDHEYDEKVMPEPTDADKLKVVQAYAASAKAHIELVKADDKVEVDAAQSMLTNFGRALGLLPAE